MRSLRATFEQGEAEGGSSVAAGNAGFDDGDASGEFARELGAVGDYFKARIAAARQSLSPADAAAAIRALRNEKSLAMRSVIDRWQQSLRNRAARPQAAQTGVKSALAITVLSVLHLRQTLG